jgi:hypothetical protein
MTYSKMCRLFWIGFLIGALLTVSPVLASCSYTAATSPPAPEGYWLTVWLDDVMFITVDGLYYRECRGMRLKLLHQFDEQRHRIDITCTPYDPMAVITL